MKMKNTVIKINQYKEVYYDEAEYNEKFIGTNLPLNRIYEDEHGDIHYYKNGGPHNENGPAIIRKDYNKVYCINGKTHRIDGPAVIYSNGDYTWYINGHYIEKETMNNWLTENNIPLDYKTWTDSDKKKFALHWSDYNG